MTDNDLSTLTWTSVALFVSSAAVFKLCQSHTETGRGRRTTRYSSRYRMRRQRSRLSPVNQNRASPLFMQHTSIDHDADGNDFDRMNGHGRLPMRRMRREDSGGRDFYPKNRNWRHFESDNEDDEGRTPIRSPYESGDESISSVSDEFVWTHGTHRKHHTKNASAWTKIKHVSRLNAISAFRQLTEEVRSDSGAEESSSAGEVNEEEMTKIEENSYAGDEADAFIIKSRQNQSLHSNASDLSGRSLIDQPIPESDSDARSLELIRSRKGPEVAAYNASILPAKVVMIRHGQSEGNVNESLYATTPDNAMRITKLGWDQARMAGKALREKVLASGEPVHFIVSPYVRAVETFHGIVSAWCDPSDFDHIQDRDERIKAWYGKLLDLGLTWHEDPRIREQDFGNYQDPAIIKQCKRERHRFGVFFYRFPHGESASDVFDRVSTFLDSLWRSFDLHKTRNYVLVTHGISIRVFLARYFRYSIDQFSMLANPKNCEMVILGHDGQGKLRLQGRCEMELETDEETKKKKVVGYKLQKRLRVLPKSAMRKVKIRVSPDD